MKTIQNSMMFLDAAPVAQPSLGKAGVSALRSAEGNGLFAELLQGKQPLQDGAAAQAETPEAEAQPPVNSRQGVLLRLQNSYGMPASAIGGSQVSQPVPSNGTTLAAAGQGVLQKSSEDPLQSLKGQIATLVADDPQIGMPKVQPNVPANVQLNAELMQQNVQQLRQSLQGQPNVLQNQPLQPNMQQNMQANLQGNVQTNVQEQAPEDSAGQAVVVPTAKGADRQRTFNLRRAHLAGEAQLAAALSDTLQTEGTIPVSAGDATKNSQPATGGTKGSEPEKDHLSARTSLAADTQNPVSIPDAMQGLAAVSLTTTRGDGLTATATDSNTGMAEQTEPAIAMAALPASATKVAGGVETAGTAVVAEQSGPARKDFGSARAAYHLKPEVSALLETVSNEVPTAPATNALPEKGMVAKEAVPTGTSTHDKFATLTSQGPNKSEIFPATSKIMGQGTNPATTSAATTSTATAAAAFNNTAPQVAHSKGLNEVNVQQTKTVPVAQLQAAEQDSVVKNGPGVATAASKGAEPVVADTKILDGTKVSLVTANPVFTGRAGEQIAVSNKEALPHEAVLQDAAPQIKGMQGLNGGANLQDKVNPVFPGRETEPVSVEKAPLMGVATPLKETAPLMADAASLNADKNLQAKVSPVSSGRTAGAPVVTEKELGSASALLQKAAPLAANIPSLNEAKNPQTTAGPVVSEQAIEPSASKNGLQAPKAAALKDVAPLQVKTQHPDEVANLQAKATLVASTREAEPAAVSEKGSGMESAVQDAAVKAPTDGLQNADLKNNSAQPAASGAPERGTQVPAASGGIVKAPVVAELNGAVSPVQEAVNEAAATASPDRFAQVPADAKGPHAAMGFHGTYAAVRGVTEQADSKQNAPVEEVGTKAASTAGTAKFVPFQGSTSQDGSGDPGKKGHPEQKAQVAAGAPVQPQGVGVQLEPVNTQAPLPEAKPVNLKSALHESILSQIKDGVVSQDFKGNGQMSIRLNPGELGELKIQVRMDDNRLHVEVHADNRMVKDLLLSNLDSLKDSLTSKNFTMEGFDVSTGGGFNSPLPEQKENPRQQAFNRSARAGAYPDQGEETKVNYLTGEVNNLLDVRF
jgi:flagellar hook-length control protein FliK